MGKNIDRGADIFEALTSHHTGRTGLSAARVASSLANNVDPDVVALQATKNSEKNNPEDPQSFTGAEMTAVAKWHMANASRSAYTKQQAGELNRAQREADQLDPQLV